MKCVLQFSSSISCLALHCSAARSLCWITAAPGSFCVQPNGSSGSAVACCPCSVPVMPGAAKCLTMSEDCFGAQGMGQCCRHPTRLIFAEFHRVSAVRSSSSLAQAAGGAGVTGMELAAAASRGQAAGRGGALHRALVICLQALQPLAWSPRQVPPTCLHAFILHFAVALRERLSHSTEYSVSPGQ